MTAAGTTLSPFVPRTKRPVGFLLLAVGAALVVFLEAYRAAEMMLAGTLVGLLSSAGIHIDADSATFYFGLGTDHPLGLHMTAECTSALLILPLVAVAAAMTFLRPQTTRRVLASLGIGALVLIAVNQLRILAIVGLVNWFGPATGYYWGHTLLGSVVSIIGGALSLVLFVWLATRNPRPRRRGGQHRGRHR